MFQETYEALTTHTLEERISSIMEEEEEMVSFPYSVHQDIHQQPTDTKPGLIFILSLDR